MRADGSRDEVALPQSVRAREDASVDGTSGDGTSPRAIYLTPAGRLFNQAMAADFAREEELVIVCGRYEGIDQRVIDRYISDEVSIGDYVLSSGDFQKFRLRLNLSVNRLSEERPE